MGVIAQVPAYPLPAGKKCLSAGAPQSLLRRAGVSAECASRVRGIRAEAARLFRWVQRVDMWVTSLTPIG